MLLVSGADERGRPSPQFSETLRERLDGLDRERSHAHLEYEDAGHAITVPYEPEEESVLEERGGTKAGTDYAAADAREHTLFTFRRGLHRRA